MKSLLIIASFVALAVASPTHRGIEAGPAMLDFEPVADGHSIVHIDPTSIARATAKGEPVSINIDQHAENVPYATSLIQIVVNLEGTTSVVNAPINVIPAAGAIVTEPEHINEAGPAMLDLEPVADGHSIIHIDPTSIARSIVKGEPVTINIDHNAENVPYATFLVQKIVNLEGKTSVVNAPINVIPAAGAIVAEPEHINEAGPAKLDLEPIAGGHSIVHVDPTSIERAIAKGEPVTIRIVQNAENVRSATSLIQIIVNVEGTTTVVNAPINVYSAAGAVVAEPEHIMEDAPEAVQVVEAAPEPVQVIEAAPKPVQVVEVAPAPIGTPVLPMPVVPEAIPEPIAIDTPELPIPVVVLSELN